MLAFHSKSGIRKKKPWKRDLDVRDPSRSVVLDLQENSDSKVKIALFEAETPQWTYRKVPKVTSFRDYGSIPIWCRKPQPLVYQMCAEDITKSSLVFQLSDAERQALTAEGTLPLESSALGKHCVMRPVKIGSPKLIPCCLRNTWRYVPRSYQTHLGRMCPCHVGILDPRRKIMVMSHPYMEDYVVLPTTSVTSSDERNRRTQLAW